MPKRTDIKSILIIGAGPIVIGQACEFDYSGAQACKALKEEGYRVILVNSNPATIMTDPNLADATYIEPITPEMVAKIIEKERPDALLPTMGGQTALNTALALYDDGTLDKYGVEMIGAKKHVIEKAEDRQLFREAMDKIGLESARSAMVRTFEEAVVALETTGLPAIIRPSFTLGGEGGGIAYNREEFEQIVRNGLAISPTHTVLVEESILGWKEYEMEVVRDHADNCIIICSIENVDPMGIHTGDSITVAPALTLTDKEYQIMRDASLAVLREIGVDTGGSNVQFAVNPDDGRLIVIEMNPRVSRSSALASKATGFPIAKIAAKLAVGYTLDELDNDITGVTPASFEPTIDYVVTKIPRFTFEKFPGAQALLGTAMKSVGEAMSIGGSFAESLQKGLRSMETGLTGLNEVKIEGAPDKAAIRAKLTQPMPFRILYAAQAFRHGLTLSEIQSATKFDPWYLRQIETLVAEEEQVRAKGLPKDKQEMLRLKKLGFSDARLAELVGMEEDDVRAIRHAMELRPVYKRIDTCAAEFPSRTSYMYSIYEGDGFFEPENEAEVTDRRKVIILGGGPNRIGQGIEFDYCCVHAAYALREVGIEAIMVNCNPETVSTDYDTSDRLYFEPLTAEDVIELCQLEQSKGELLGVIVQYGGQTPLKLSAALEKAGIPILGTSPDSIDLAEDRDRFQELIHKLGLKQPANGIARSVDEAVKIAEGIGYPIVIRPSYVLGGRAMEIVHTTEDLLRYMTEAVQVSGKSPVLIDSFLQDAIEIDADAVSDGENVFVAGIMQHIEEAGIHSGDSACSLPPYSLGQDMIDRLKEQTVQLAKALDVVGLMNVQFAIKGDVIYLIEVNPRASRTVPFVAKATGNPIAKIGARIMAGEKLSDFKINEGPFKHIAVKEAVLPFNRFPGVDTLLGPEMRSTGEVMGLDTDFGRAFAKAQMAAGHDLPQSGKIFMSVKNYDKPAAVQLARDAIELGFVIVATHGTAEALEKEGLDVTPVNKVQEGRPHIVDMMKNGDINLVFNTTESKQAVVDSFSIRRTALSNDIPYYTTIAGARATLRAIDNLKRGALAVRPVQEYLGDEY
ncbi:MULTISPECIES: carbamoyl-phosphate synthase large subunit [Thalassospira]|jgi:carbamoyl-phosphate synthase large subunit|uniref:Carbamoyl phosphate synthase large chain n=1 Tax=Thalassospira xiamenensis TaxID=220697 RepID=A0ABR5Y5N4_9PROT|nr:MULTISPECIES: carbamoyl-phosphate synthase large subunit [Thalassospira]KZD05789.1 carbamoyl phosphate synthase large subunit [Thalassospira xiamenensis]KZD09524.1 carbamoyl phosphate synthase large subunit [Thalassospira xiamenensis]MAB31392.1 carbamoyl-phosphate synthase large subunit [Thalassospira sp.]MBA05675.1 carbamoyl-phosphate synthase large subunit [Thalassospira sp.]MDM7974473.1 carbamoyl-phosphate synthase large subunit [Thalassospira xiamenensis]|tara:strand:+ start:1763 stop:5005 length:3243 start_codon:yes stop_codon:yes gene_type:complete